MRLRWRLATLVLLIAGFGAIAAPSNVLACSCAEAPSLRVAVDEWGSAVFVGRAAGRTGDTVAFAVERWFAGTGAAPMVSVQAGNGAMCGIDIQPGEHLVLTAIRDETTGAFNPSICSPFARVGTTEANALVAEAERTFGPGTPFGGLPEAGGPSAGPGWAPLAALGIAGVMVGGLALAAVVLLRRRRVA